MNIEPKDKKITIRCTKSEKVRLERILKGHRSLSEAQLLRHIVEAGNTIVERGGISALLKIVEEGRLPSIPSPNTAIA